MASLLLVGAGQIGSRHLQGLASSRSNLEITVVDPSIASLETAKLRWIAAGGCNSHHKIHMSRALPPDLTAVDIALIATSARGRASTIREISNSVRVRYWIIEKVVSQSIHELKLIEEAISGCEGAWVNTPRRMMAWHQSIKAAFVDQRPLQMHYSGGLWGLACNSIHFLDLVTWWSAASLEAIDTRGLEHRWHNSKRSGYFEITGDLLAYFSDGSFLHLSSKIDNKIQPIEVLLNNSVRWKIDELSGTAVSSTLQRTDGKIELQSDLTGKLVDGILLLGRCGLPSFKESACLHAIFLDAMLEHWNMAQSRNDHCVPIT